MNLINFAQFWLSEHSLRALKERWFESPTEIQAKTIPLLLNSNNDVIGQARTWTWKTAAFWLPILEKINVSDKCIQALILTPTRELAIQVTEEINSYKWGRKINIATLYWWQSYNNEFNRLKSGMHIIVWTPGRIMDHLERWTLDIGSIRFFVLDEADEMLNMGFREDIQSILETTPNDKKMLFFSATMPNWIIEIAKKYMKKYDLVSAKENTGNGELIEQIYFQVARNDKFEALCRIIDMEDDFLWIVFCRTKIDVDELTVQLQDRGYDVDWLHWDIKQSTRERILNKIKLWTINILIATDVAARWIDIQNLTHVINYSLPESSESYIHRIWRTWRAWKTWVAITFITASEHRSLFYIQKDNNIAIKKENLPTVKDILRKKKNKLLESVIDILDWSDLSWYSEISSWLLDKRDPISVVSAILKLFCKDVFDQNSYKEFEERGNFVDNKGITRLFLAKWKKDKMTPGKIITLVKDYIDIDSSNINDIWIYDDFSFLNLPFNDAEELLHRIKKKSKWTLPIITKAKSKESPGRNSRPKRRK